MTIFFIALSVFSVLMSIHTGIVISRISYKTGVLRGRIEADMCHRRAMLESLNLAQWGNLASHNFDNLPKPGLLSRSPFDGFFETLGLLPKENLDSNLSEMIQQFQQEAPELLAALKRRINKEMARTNETN